MHDQEADEPRHDHRYVRDARDLLQHHEAARERVIGTTSLSPVLERTVKLRKSNSIHVRSPPALTAAVKLPGSIAC